MPADVLLFTAPDFQQVSAATLLAASPADDVLKQQILDLQTQMAAAQTQIADLEARVAVLEGVTP